MESAASKRPRSDIQDTPESKGSNDFWHGIPTGTTKIAEIEFDDVVLACEHLIDAAEPVLFFGEGNFTFSTALAARRESFVNITATTFGHLPGLNPQLMNIRTISSANFKPGSDDERLERIGLIANLDGKSATRIDSIDATNADTISTLVSRFPRIPNLFFQCPWRYPGLTSSLIIEFMLSASKSQIQGELLFIGINCHDKYVLHYGLAEVLKSTSAVYSVSGVDKCFPFEMLRFGYFHHSESKSVLYHDLLDYHASLCFQRL